MKKLALTVGLLAVGALTATAGELGYVESLGTGVFDTGVVPGSKTRMVLDFQFTDPNLANCEMGWASSGAAESMTVGISGQNFFSRCSSNYNDVATCATTDNARHTWDLASGSQKFDGTEYATGTLTDKALNYANRSIWLFVRHQGWNGGGLTGGVYGYTKGRLYSCKFYEGETLVKDYVPWEKGGEFGLYDRVNDLFIALEPADFTAPEPAATVDRDLEYVASTGSEYFDTGVVPTSRTRMDIDFQYAVQGGYLFGWMASGYKECFTFYGWGAATFRSLCDATDANPVEVSAPALNRHHLSMTSGSQKLDGVEYATTVLPDWAGEGNTIAIFGRHIGWSGGGVNGFSKVKLYGCKIWEDDKLIRNYVPILRNGVAGFLETVDGVFVDAGGTLVAGPVRYAPRPYVETAKSQFIDTGVTPSKTTRFEVDAAFLNITDLQQVGWMASGSKDEFLFGVSGSKFHSAVSDLLIDQAPVLCAADTNRHVWALSSGSQKIDGVELATMSLGELDQTQGTFYLGARHNGWSTQPNAGYPAAMRIYGCKVYDNGKLIRDFVPALSNRVAGLYERVQGRFCVSLSDKPFVVGPVATPVASVDFPDKPWCDTGVVPSSKVKVVSDMRFLTLKACQMGWASTGKKEAMTFGITSDLYFGGYVGDNYSTYGSFGVPADTLRHLWKFSSGEQIIASGSRLTSDRLVGTATIGDTAKVGQTLYLGGRHCGWQANVDGIAFMRSYGLKAYTDGELTADLVPAIVNGKPCLYDSIGCTAYYSLHSTDSLGWHAQVDKDQYGFSILVR